MGVAVFRPQWPVDCAPLGRHFPYLKTRHKMRRDTRNGLAGAGVTIVVAMSAVNNVAAHRAAIPYCSFDAVVRRSSHCRASVRNMKSPGAASALLSSA